MVATVATVAYLGLEARAVEVQVQLSSGLPRFIIVGLARQGGRRKPRAGARRAGRDRPRASAQADHGQPVARRPAQGRLAFRPADRARPAGGDRRDRCRDACRIMSRSASCASTGGSRLAGRAARGAPRLGAGQGADLPGGAGQRGGLGRAARSARRARPAGAARASQGHGVAARRRRWPRPSRPMAGPTSRRSRGRRSPSARSRSPRPAGTIC